MNEVIEVSYTGDLLAHRRCGRAWAYEKHAGFNPYEAVQAMEGRLVHHAMEWLTREYADTHRHARSDDLREQLEHYFRVLWARGIRTTFVSKRETLDRVIGNIFPSGKLDPVVRAAIEGAQHTEYELRSVRKVLPAEFGGKSRILLTGILDLVVQQQAPLTYEREWHWDGSSSLSGKVVTTKTQAVTGDLEIWDYKGTRAGTTYVDDYVRQLLTYAELYRERAGVLPVRCVLFFINEKSRARRLLTVPVEESIVRAALKWTQQQVREVRATSLTFEQDPLRVVAGDLTRIARPLGERLTTESVQQCTACSFRFGCDEYETHLKGGSSHPDIDIYNVLKN